MTPENLLLRDQIAEILFAEKTISDATKNNLSGAIVALDGIKDMLNTIAEADGGKFGGSSSMLYAIADHIHRIGESLDSVWKDIAK